MGSDSHQTYTAFVGIDWADAKHDICVQATGSSRREFSCIAHEPARIESWACSLRERFGAPVAVALELTKGPIVYALQKYDFIVLFPVNPVTLARYRQAFTPMGRRMIRVTLSFNARADPTAISGKADTTGEESRRCTQPLRRGSGDSMYTGEARNTGSPEACSAMSDRTPARDGPGALG